MLIAHNPGVHALAARLLTESSGAGARCPDGWSGGFAPATAVAFDIDEGGRARYDGLFSARGRWAAAGD